MTVATPHGRGARYFRRLPRLVLWTMLVLGINSRVLKIADMIVIFCREHGASLGVSDPMSIDTNIVCTSVTPRLEFPELPGEGLVVPTYSVPCFRF